MNLAAYRAARRLRRYRYYRAGAVARLPGSSTLAGVVPGHVIVEQTRTGRPMMLRLSQTALTYYQPPRVVQAPHVVVDTSTTRRAHA